MPYLRYQMREARRDGRMRLLRGLTTRRRSRGSSGRRCRRGGRVRGSAGAAVEPGLAREGGAGGRDEAGGARREGTVRRNEAAAAEAAGLPHEELEDVVDDVAGAGAPLGEVVLVQQAQRLAWKRRLDIQYIKSLSQQSCSGLPMKGHV